MSLAPGPTVSDDEAVRAVILEESEAFFVLDLDRWAACWLQENRSHEVMVAPEIGTLVLRGWSDIYAHTADSMSRGVTCSQISHSKVNMRIAVHGSRAFVTFDTVAVERDGRRVDLFETRVLERVGTRWLISFLSFLQLRPAERTESIVAVDRAGRVVWIDDSARATLQAHPCLTVSQGRLRATRPAWDRTLQAAIARASDLHGFFDQYGYVARTGQAYRCPVVLGEDEDGRTISCLLTARDGATYVDFSAGGDFADRIGVASAVFGLSPAQARLASEIVAGRTLTAAAQGMGISENTARTHLSRIFDKTGVGSQTSLVRVLMSVG